MLMLHKGCRGVERADLADIPVSNEHPGHLSKFNRTHGELVNPRLNASPPRRCRCRGGRS